MDGFLRYMQEFARVAVGFVVAGSFVAGASKMETGGGALAGGALVATRQADELSTTWSA